MPVRFEYRVRWSTSREERTRLFARLGNAERFIAKLWERPSTITVKVEQRQVGSWEKFIDPRCYVRSPHRLRCEDCGSVFTAVRVDARFCCEAHRMRAHRRRRVTDNAAVSLYREGIDTDTRNGGRSL